MRTMYEVMEEIRRQIDWRGPSGRTMGHIVIEREAMIVLVDAIRHMENVLVRIDDNKEMREALEQMMRQVIVREEPTDESVQDQEGRAKDS